MMKLFLLDSDKVVVTFTVQVQKDTCAAAEFFFVNACNLPLIWILHITLHRKNNATSNEI